jgi:hypothetical protein
MRHKLQKVQKTVVNLLFLKPGLNKLTMNKTMNILKQHSLLWSLEAIMGSVAPVYPTTSIRGEFDNQGSPGTR